MRNQKFLSDYPMSGTEALRNPDIPWEEIEDVLLTIAGFALISVGALSSMAAVIVSAILGVLFGLAQLLR